MPFSIVRISAEGIRGINTRLERDLTKGLNLLSGPNGVGKSSILQSIEWCLTGRLPYLRGPDFRHEDAIVNLFHPKKTAKVSLVLDDGKETVTVTRTRKMTRSTTAGSSQLEVQYEGRTIRGDEAQEKVNQIIGLGLEDFPRTLYLHQEAIREFISEDPKERSRAIDKLLGMAELRDLSEALDVKRKITLTVGGLEKRVEALKRDKVQFAVSMRQRLEERKKKLQEKGFQDQQLSLMNVVSEIEALQRDVVGAAEKMGATPPKLRPTEPILTSVEESAGELERTIRSLDRFRINALQNTEERRLQIENALQQIDESRRALEAFGEATVDSLSQEEKRISKEMSDLKGDFEKFQAMATEGSALRVRLDSLGMEISQLELKAKQIESEHGDEKRIQKTLEDGDNRLKSIRQRIAQSTTYDQLATLAIQYISETKENSCPVCAQPINHSQVVERLATQVKVSVAKEMQELREKEKTIAQEIKDLQRVLEDYQRMILRISALKENAQKARLEAETRIGVALGEDLAARIDEAKQRLADLTKAMDGKRQALNEVRQKREALVASTSKLAASEKSLQTLLKTLATGTDLLEVAKVELQGIEKAKVEYRDITALDALTGRHSRITEVVAFLKDEDEVKEIEAELPYVTQLIGDLGARIQSLRNLDGSLSALRQVISQYEKEAVTATLSSLEELLNRYYRAILGHPYFQTLRIQIESEEPLLYSIRASGREDSTYIPTRFSNAQMNVAALALFLSNYSKMAGGLSCAIMDDPSQSMDTEHKKALASTIRELAETNQLIIATQDAELETALRKNVPTLQLIALKGWDPNGPILNQT